MRASLGCALAAAVAIAMSPVGVATGYAAQKLSVAHSTWIGYGALYVAKEKGFFEKAGLDIDLRLIEASSDSNAAMQAGRIDVVAATVDTFSLFAGNGSNLSLLIGLDESAGGDGVVVKNAIASVSDLKGHTVAAQMGSPSQFLLSEALDHAGLKLSDVKIIDMKSGDAGAAFVAGSVDAAVTWQPWLSKAGATNFGKILIDTRTLRGIIVDALAARGDFAKQHQADFKAFADAYYQGVDYLAQNPAEGNEIIGRNLKMNKETLEASLKDVRFFNKSDNAAFFTGADSGAVKLAKDAAEFYHRIGVLRNVPDAVKLVGISPDLAK